jgi:hypothetical protein
MRLYNMWAIIKIIVGISIIGILYNYVNVYQDPAIGISFWFLGIFMIVWGIGYFMFLLSYKFFSKEHLHKQASLSYKLSLLLGMYVMVNITFIITDHWNKLLWLAIIIAFIALQTLFWNQKKKEIQY